MASWTDASIVGPDPAMLMDFRTAIVTSCGVGEFSARCVHGGLRSTPMPIVFR
jgi:hypothetical protein